MDFNPHSIDLANLLMAAQQYAGHGQAAESPGRPQSLLDMRPHHESRMQAPKRRPLLPAPAVAAKRPLLEEPLIDLTDDVYASRNYRSRSPQYEDKDWRNTYSREQPRHDDTDYRYREHPEKAAYQDLYDPYEQTPPPRHEREPVRRERSPRREERSYSRQETNPPRQDHNSPFDPSKGRGKCMLCKFPISSMENWKTHCASPFHRNNVNKKVEEIGERKFNIRYGDLYMPPSEPVPPKKPYMEKKPPNEPFRAKKPLDKPPPVRNEPKRNEKESSAGKAVCRFGAACRRLHVPSHMNTFIHPKETTTKPKPVEATSSVQKPPMGSQATKVAEKPVCKFGMSCLNINNQLHRNTFAHEDKQNQSQDSTKGRATRTGPKKEESKSKPSVSNAKDKKPQPVRGAPSNVPNIMDFMQLGSEKYDPFEDNMEVEDMEIDEGNSPAPSPMTTHKPDKKANTNTTKSSSKPAEAKGGESISDMTSALAALAKSNASLSSGSSIPKDMADLVKMLADKIRKEEEAAKSDGTEKKKVEIKGKGSGQEVKTAASQGRSPAGQNKPGSGPDKDRGAGPSKDKSLESNQKKDRDGRSDSERSGSALRNGRKDSRWGDKKVEDNKGKKPGVATKDQDKNLKPGGKPPGGGGSGKQEKKPSVQSPSKKPDSKPPARGAGAGRTTAQSPGERTGNSGGRGRGRGRGLLGAGPGMYRGPPGMPRPPGPRPPSLFALPHPHGPRPLLGPRQPMRGPHPPSLFALPVAGHGDPYDTEGGYIEEAPQEEFVGGYVDEMGNWIESSQVAYEVEGKSSDDIEQAFRNLSKQHHEAKMVYEGKSNPNRPAPGRHGPSAALKGSQAAPFGQAQPRTMRNPHNPAMEITAEEQAAVQQMQELTGITDARRLMQLAMAMNDMNPEVLNLLGNPQVQHILSSLQELLTLLESPGDQGALYLQQLEQMFSTEYFQNPHIYTLLDVMGFGPKLQQLLPNNPYMASMGQHGMDRLHTHSHTAGSYQGGHAEEAFPPPPWEEAHRSAPAVPSLFSLPPSSSHMKTSSF